MLMDVILTLPLIYNLYIRDHAVGHLWDYIQNNIPQMAGNTSIIVAEIVEIELIF